MSCLSELPPWLLSAMDKPVAVFGRGRSGEGARALIERLGGRAVFYDEAAGMDCRSSFGADCAREHAMVVYSPGFSETHPWLEQARQAGVQTVAELDFGGALWEGPLVAVTGTNGKTTLTAFLATALQRAGKESYATGNIGDPISSLVARLPDRTGWAVCEVSSFQSSALTRLRPDAVLWTNFAEDHLDLHGSMERYFRAKLALARRAPPGRFFYGRTVDEAARAWGAELDPLGLVEEEAPPESIGIAGTVFQSRPDLHNYLMARALWMAMGLEEAPLREAARAYCKAPHRMQFIGEIEGISFWDDSKGTNFHAVLCGLERFSSPTHWIGGGRAKGGDIEGFARELAGGIATAHLIGETRFRMASALRLKGAEVYEHDSLEAATQAAFAKSRPGEHIVLSPGFSSFDMFESYIERGDAFAKAMDSIALDGQRQISKPEHQH